MKCFFIQPYYAWLGHFKQYTDSLVSEHEEVITVSSRQFKNILDYTMLRFFCSVKAIIKLLKKSTKNDRFYFLEFEPLSFLIFYPFIIRAESVFFTIHAVSTPVLGKGLASSLVGFQRFLFKHSIRLYSKKENVHFIVHSHNHKHELASLSGVSVNSKIHVIDYPCPIPKQNNQVGMHAGYNSNVIFCFGAMRRDKQLAPFISALADFGFQGYRFVFAGVITDPAIHSLTNNLPDFIAIEDGFIDESRLNELIKQSNFMLVPYGDSYTGGAGPLKDAASFGKPCLVSNLPLFEEVKNLGGYCKMFSSIDELYEQLFNTKEIDYKNLVINAIKYAESNNWSTLRGRYLGCS